MQNDFVLAEDVMSDDKEGSSNSKDKSEQNKSKGKDNKDNKSKKNKCNCQNRNSAEQKSKRRQAVKDRKKGDSGSKTGIKSSKVKGSKDSKIGGKSKISELGNKASAIKNNIPKDIKLPPAVPIKIPDVNLLAIIKKLGMHAVDTAKAATNNIL